MKDIKNDTLNNVSKKHLSAMTKNKLTRGKALKKLERYKKFMDFDKFSLSEKCQLLELWSERVLKMNWEQAEQWLFSAD